MGGDERWRAGLTEPEPPFDPYATASQAEYRAPGLHDADRDRYGEEYDYYWGDIRMPLWIALILQVPWRQRLDIFVMGFIVGLVIAGVAVTWGLLLSQY